VTPQHELYYYSMYSRSELCQIVVGRLITRSSSDDNNQSTRAGRLANNCALRLRHARKRKLRKNTKHHHSRREVPPTTTARGCVCCA
jgi:hypothetical protein